jgi:DNA-binding CsgD family transcriptional regulator
MLKRNSNEAKASARECEVLKMLCSEAAPTKEIAARMGISESTVTQYIDHMLRTLQLTSRSALMIWGYQHPEAMRGEWVKGIDVHPPRCICGGAFCSLMDRAA